MFTRNELPGASASGAIRVWKIEHRKIQMKKLLLTALLAVTSSSAATAPNGNYNLEIKTKFPWPMAGVISSDKLTLKSRGRTSIVGQTQTSGVSATKITGKANFTTKICGAGSSVKVTLRFNKDGTYKSGNASGRCKRTSGTASFKGAVVLK